MIKGCCFVALFALLFLAAPARAINWNANIDLGKSANDGGAAAYKDISENDSHDIPFLLSGDCSDYIDLSDQLLPILEYGTTEGATNDYGPFLSVPPSWHGSNWSPETCAGPDVTYKWTVPAYGYYTISLLGSSYDTGLLLYNFTCPSEPSYPGDFITGNDNVYTLQSELYCLEFSAGLEILIIVDGYANSYGSYQLSIQEEPSPRNPDSFITSIMEAEHIPGLSACAIRDGEIVWSGNYGYANIDQDIVPTDSTLFLLASVSKTFVAVALMQLWEDGLFSLDDDINQYLPWEVHNPFYPDSVITFRMLMAHTSGIIDNLDVLYSEPSFGEDSPIPLGEFLMNYLTPGGTYYFAGANFGNYAPGTVWNYCNVATALAGYLVERMNPDTLSFENYCQQSIFAPLDMNNSSFFLANLNIEDIAVPYYWNGNYNYYPHPGVPYYPAGQLRTSTGQLARYLTAFMQHGQIDGTRILDSTTVALITTIQFPNVDAYTGLFWLTYWPGDRQAWGHNGAADGCRTQMWYSPNENAGVIVLTNGESDWGSWHLVQGFFEYMQAGGGCSYIAGDINGNGAANGIDVSYGVNYFKGGLLPPLVCDMCPQTQPFYAAGDINGSCTFNGIDITYFVSYLKGGPPLQYCPTCPPAGLTEPPAPAIQPKDAVRMGLRSKTIN